MHVLVHGGAGRHPTEPDRRQRVLEAAAEIGTNADDPLEAVECAVRTLESSHRFNAGVGSAVQSDGVIRTDAGIMTEERVVGAACSMAGVEHAVSVARLVAKETPHVLLAGEHAVALADAFAVESNADLWCDRTRERWDELTPPDGDSRAHLEWVREQFDQPRESERNESESRTDGGSTIGETDHDTVGAVASDGEHLAAATSTGGRWFALAGRVGDVPQVGAGFYCTPDVAVSATGAGEDIARVTLSRQVTAHVECGLSTQRACERALEEFAELTNSTAGVIAIDTAGDVGSAFNSEAMQTASAHSSR